MPNLSQMAEDIFSYENLLKCYYLCRKRKRNTINAIKFEINLEANLFKLQEELKNHTYQPGQSICFVVRRPKLREIFAADFRDRIVHHVLVGYLEKIWEPKFIDQSYACRLGKGTHRALNDLKKYLAKASRGYRQKVYYLKLDIQSFFVSINKNILYEIIKKQVKNPEILWLAKTIIFHNPTENYYKKGQLALFDLIPNHKTLFKSPFNCGLPIGNLTSQFFANMYLNELDQLVKHKFKIKYYLRYVDDFILLAEDKEKLKEWRREIDKFLQGKLALKLHPKKQVFQEINKGIDFVGFLVKPDYVLMRRTAVNNFKEKFRYFVSRKRKDVNWLDEQKKKEILAVVNSYYGQFGHAQTFGLRQKLWQENLGGFERILEPRDKNFCHFGLIQ